MQERVSLSELTTLRVGGEARYVADCANEEDVDAALAFAKEKNLPWRVLGGGSNVLAGDAGFPGVVLHMIGSELTVAEDGDAFIITADAGVSWDALVDAAAERGLWGIENLAGIPGTVGASPVQNIGAYGTEVKDTLTMVRVYDSESREVSLIRNEECDFGYRDSRFKKQPGHIILSVSFRLLVNGMPALGYKDLASAQAEGLQLRTPAEIGEAVRAIRARKFPDLRICGTAGSFFKNPTIAVEAYERLKAQHEGVPGFPNSEGIKIPLAFVLDQILGLRGYREGKVWLFDAQPLVLVADEGACARDIDVFANAVAARVFDATGIVVEREVRTFP